MNEQILKFWVGVMVVSTLLIVGILILWLGNTPAIFQKTYTVYVDFNDAPSVTPNTPIRKSGILIGRVKNVELLREGGVRVTAAVHSDVDLPTNEVCQVKTSFLGDAEIEFALPPGVQAAKKSIAPETVLKGKRAADPLAAVANLEANLSDAVNSVSGASQKFADTLGKIDTILGENETHISSIVQQTDETLKLLKKTTQFTSDLLDNPEFSEELKAEVRQLPQTLREARTTIVQMRTTMQNMDNTMGLVDANLRNIKDFTEPLGENGRGIVEQIDQSVRRLNNLMVEMESFGKSINSQDGTLGRLVKDDELYQRLNQTVRNVEEISYRIKPIINDVRIISDKLARHPGAILRDAVRPGPGTKGLPPSNETPGYCPTGQSVWQR
ncbi:MAG: MCE family protein [Pirellulales bacterium]|nr:MCE family protein [Pirellulales bacterium]